MASNQQKVLNLGEKAPYTGVLVSDDMFRYYQTNDFEINILRKRAFDCEESMDEMKKEPSIIQPLWFIGGFILGAVVINKAKE